MNRLLRLSFIALCCLPLLGGQLGGVSLTGTSMNAIADNCGHLTTFGTTEDPISEGGIWLNGETDGTNWSDVAVDSTIGGGIAYGADFVDGDKARYADPVANLKTSYITFNDDQWTEGVVYRFPGYSNPSDKHEIELLVRWEITAGNIRGYELLWAEEGEMAIVRWEGPAGQYQTVKATLDNAIPGQAVTGDVVRFGVTGQDPNITFSVTLNGSPVAILDGWVDASAGTRWGSGQPGIGFWPTPGSTLNKYGWSSWQACNDGES